MSADFNPEIAPELITLASSLNGKGVAHLAQGQLDLALQALQKAYSYLPMDTAINHNLATVYWQMQKPLDAISHYAQVYLLDPSDRPTVLSLCQAYMLCGDLESARAYCEAFLQKFPDDQEFTQIYKNMGAASRISRNLANLGK